MFLGFSKLYLLPLLFITLYSSRISSASLLEKLSSVSPILLLEMDFKMRQQRKAVFWVSFICLMFLKHLISPPHLGEFKSVYYFLKQKQGLSSFWKKELQERHLQRDPLYLRLTLKELVKVALEFLSLTGYWCFKYLCICCATVPLLCHFSWLHHVRVLLAVYCVWSGAEKPCT